MTLKIDLGDLRARVEARKQRRADRDAALRGRGVTPFPVRAPKNGLTKPLLSRVLPWRRRDD